MAESWRQFELGGAVVGSRVLFGTLAVFIVLAGLGVLMPLILYLAAPVKMVRVLDNVMEWLMVNSNTILMVVLGGLGAQLVGQGVDSF